MKELGDIFSLLQTARSAGERFALATLVRTQGSSYRRVGAKMLVTESGKTAGAISGGCLEGDARKKCLFAMQTGESSLVVYDSLDEDDVRFGFGLGCNGAIALLIEPSNLPTLNERLARYEDFLRAPTPTVVATIYGAEGGLKREIGKTLRLDDAHAETSNIERQDLRHALCADARDALQRRRAAIKRYELAEGVAEALIELLAPPIHLVIFGAGYDAIPLAKFAKELGWQVSVVDGRASYLARERFASADRLILAKAKDLRALTIERERAAAVILSHNFDYDLEALATLLPLRLSYLGVLGPKRRAEKLLSELERRGLRYDDDALKNLYAPIGLDIGAELPEEIALSILAEIKAVMTQRNGAFLRERNAPIHDRAMF